MANFKVVISDPTSKKAFQKEVDQAGSGLVNKKVGDKVPGASLGLEGYELQITGGSDNAGFPMRPDVEGPARKKIILTSPPGYHPKHSGNRKRKSVRGNTVSLDISQVNLKVVKAGNKKIDEIMGKKKGESKEEAKSDGKAEKPADKPAEKKQDTEPKPEAKSEEKKDESKPAEKSTPSEEKKEDVKTEQSESADAKKAEEKMGIKPIEEAEKDAKGEKK